VRHRFVRGPLAAGLVLLAACAEGDVVQRQAQTGADGIQATGILDGKRIAVSSGEPEVVRGDCDPADGLDRDLCIVGRTIDGVTINVVIENPDALVAGESLPVLPSSCAAAACDELSEQAVVDVRVAGEQRRATRGSLRPTSTEGRIAAEFDLRFPDGDRLTGRFDVDPPG
jgi:hypothetical protein